MRDHWPYRLRPQGRFRPADNCSYEYACVHCPFLQVDAAELPRLLEIEAETGARLAQAESDGREGEVIALTDTLSHIVEKRALASAATTR